MTNNELEALLRAGSLFSFGESTKHLSVAQHALQLVADKKASLTDLGPDSPSRYLIAWVHSGS